MNRATCAAAGVAALLSLSACSSSSASPAGQDAASARVDARVEALQAAVTSWENASTLAQAQAGAEAARNLVTGPDVTGYGDTDGDGRPAGANHIGLLPGEEGQPGLVTAPTTSCVDRDVLGGSWGDPAARWADVRARVAAWTPSNNTFPELASHPQRVVGWASLTLGTTSLDTAHEYAGHAQLHVAATRGALAGC